MNEAAIKRTGDTADLLAKVADEFLNAVEQGQQPDIEEYAERYPEIAGVLRDVLPALALLKPSLSHSAATSENGASRSDESSPSPLVGEGRGEGVQGGDPESGILGDFRLIHEIGRGGMGVVYEAEQISLGRTVALKVLPFAAMLDSRQLTRFRNEARAAASLHHHNIVPVFSVGCERSVHFYAMQLIEGESLANIFADMKGQGAESGDRSQGAGGGSQESGDRGQESVHSPTVSVGTEGSGFRVPGSGNENPAAPSPRGEGRGEGAVNNLTESLPSNSAHQSPLPPFSPSPLHSPTPSPVHPQSPAPETQTLRHHDTLPDAKKPNRTPLSGSVSGRAYFNTIAELGIQAAEALDYAHDQGVIHRDIKPANLLLDGTGRLWITDFGLARLESDAGMTMTGDLVGTLRYMSPEQALAKRVVVDHRTDIYSLGVTLYELLALRPAFDGDDRHALLKQIAFEEPPLLRKLNRQIPVELETIVEKAIRKNPTERYATAQELADDLRSFLANKPIKAKPPTWREQAVKWAQRHPAAVRATMFTLLVTIIAIAGSIGWVVRDKATRQAVLEQQISQAIDESKTWYQADKLTEAVSAMKRAEGLLASGGGSEKLKRHVDQWRADLATVERLCSIREKKTGMDNDTAKDRYEAYDAYKEEFCRYGFDLNALEADKVAERIRNSPIKQDLVPALDAWYQVTTKQDKPGINEPPAAQRPPGEKEILQIARLADPDPWRDRLRDLIQRGDKAALSKLASEEEVLAEPTATVLLLSNALYSQRNYALAVEILRRVQRDHPADFWVNCALIKCMFKTKDVNPAELIGFSRVIVALRPESSTANASLAYSFMDAHEYAEAEVALREAIRLAPDVAMYYLNLGVILSGINRDAEAETAYREAIRLGPDRALFRSNLGSILAKQGKYSEVEAEFRKAVWFNPKHQLSQINLAEFLYEQNRYAEAENVYREAVKLTDYRVGQEEIAVLYEHLGHSLLEQGKQAEAEEAFREAIRLKPDEPEFKLNLGIALSSHGKFEEAAEAYREAIRLKPDSADGLNNLAWLLANCSEPKVCNPAEAVKLAQKAVELAREDGDWWNTLGVAQYRTADYVGAIESLEKSEQLKPDKNLGLDATFLAMAHWQLDHKEEARQWYGKAVQWTKKNKSQDSGELIRFQAEAAALMMLPAPEPKTNLDPKSESENSKP